MRPPSPAYSFVMAAVAVAASISTAAITNVKPGRQGGATPVRLGDLTLDRAIHFTVPLNSNWSVTCPVPSTFGLAITELSGFPYHGSPGPSDQPDYFARRATIRINSVPNSSFLLIDSGQPERIAFNPPLIVRPGDILTIEMSNNLIYPFSFFGPQFPILLDSPEITVGAWVLYPGEI